MEDIRVLRKQISELESSNKRFRLMADSLPVLISYVDSEHRYRFNNRAYEEWHGLPKAEIYGKHVREILGEETYHGIKKYIENALSGKKVSYERLFNSNSVERYLHVDYVPDFGEDGKVNGFFVLVYDMTSLKKTEEDLKHYASLSLREKEVMQYVVEGKSSAAIAKILNLSAKTVETYRSRLMTKLNVPNLVALVRFTAQQGLISHLKTPDKKL